MSTKNINIIALISFILVFLFGFFFKDISEYFFGGQNILNSKGELLKVVVQISGGIILLLGAFYSLNIANSMKENNKLIEKGNIAERFKNAINMLDSKNSNIFLGGIYALNNIAIDNKEYREQVFNILVEYINNNTRSLPSWENLEKQTRLNTQPSIDIITILKLLFSKESSIYRDFRANFLNAKLYGAKLNDYNFSMCSFSNVEFQNSSFIKTWFIESQFNDSDFTLSDFTNSYFTGSKINNNSKLACCRFYWTDFTGCLIQQVDFSCSIMLDVSFDGARVFNCIFNGVEIVNFGKASFVGVCFASIKTMGLVCSGNGLVARGARFEQGVSVSDFKTSLKGLIGKKANINISNKLEDFPHDELEKFKNIFDIKSLVKSNYHTLYFIEENPRKTTGWVFSDIDVLTVNDYENILNNYDIALKKIKLS